MEIMKIGFRTPEICRMLCVDIDTVRSWCNSEKLKSIRFDKYEHHYIKKGDLIDFLYRNPKYAEIYLTQSFHGKDLLVQYEIRSKLSEFPQNFSISQIADCFGIEENTVRSWIRKGFLNDSARKVGIKGIFVEDLKQCFEKYPVLKLRYGRQLERKIENGFNKS